MKSNAKGKHAMTKDERDEKMRTDMISMIAKDADYAQSELDRAAISQPHLILCRIACRMLITAMRIGVRYLQEAGK